jgi:1-acyl-sn-glycerol-3-phosphate acyltransferase
MLVGASLTLVLLVLRVPYQKVHGWITAPIFASVTKVAAIKLHVHYHPAFDPDRRSVYTQNHINLLDGHLASAVIPHAFSGLMNSWQFKIPIYGWLMSMSKGIPVYRQRRDKLIESISREARNRKEIGMSVLTFPEGHRTLDGNIRPFRRGVFLMARNAEMPIVPIAVRGLYEVNNKRSGWWFFPGKTVEVFVGPPFETDGLSSEGIGELANRVHAWSTYCLDHGTWPPDAPNPEMAPEMASEAIGPATSAAQTLPT